MTIKICTIVGARPQFIKASVVSNLVQKEYQDRITEILVHTGQHFDANMSDVFFQELNMPKPKYHLDIHGGTHTQMTSRMMQDLEKIFLIESPNLVLVYGDTNSTFAGALVASQMGIPIAHIEAGLRSYNWQMPEERNRRLVDHMSDLLFCPTENAQNNLLREDIQKEICFSGDVMLDLISQIKIDSSLVDQITKGKTFSFMTLHRAETCSNQQIFNEMVAWIKQHSDTEMLVWAVHPRAKQCLRDFETNIEGLTLISPIGYTDTLAFLKNAKRVYTDSGGLQKEAFFVNTPCITMRDETEWVETLYGKQNQLWKNVEISVSRDEDVDNYSTINAKAKLFGDGFASKIILDSICDYFSKGSKR